MGRSESGSTNNNKNKTQLNRNQDQGFIVATVGKSMNYF